MEREEAARLANARLRGLGVRRRGGRPTPLTAPTTSDCSHHHLPWPRRGAGWRSTTSTRTQGPSRHAVRFGVPRCGCPNEGSCRHPSGEWQKGQSRGVKLKQSSGRLSFWSVCPGQTMMRSNRPALPMSSCGTTTPRRPRRHPPSIQHSLRRRSTGLRARAQTCLAVFRACAHRQAPFLTQS